MCYNVTNIFIEKGATTFNININVEEICGQDKLVIELIDDGVGMNKDTIINNFWNLGESKSKDNKESIGEKGHGTKIYLRSDKVVVYTSDGDNAYESVCEGAFNDLYAGKIHTPMVRESEEKLPRGTHIRIEGYNHNQRGKLKQEVIKDYLYWFTKLGTVENQFEGKVLKDFTVFLKALDVDEPEKLEMGHPFAEINDNTNKLFEEKGEKAADFFVKKYVYQDQTLDELPEVKFDVVIYYEGDTAKRQYNKMLNKERSSSKTGTYKVADRYGLWLCKDYIPVQNVNSWIKSFGTGSNSFGLLHGFINCQKFSLTANRGTIANTNQQVIEDWYVELKYQLGSAVFNHTFSNIRYIVCWELAKRLKDGTRLETSVENETRELKIVDKGSGKARKIWLDDEDSGTKIKVICLKEIIEKELHIQLQDQ